jgi:Putative peptidoglycan binding domain
MKRAVLTLCLFGLLGVGSVVAQDIDELLFRTTDPLCQRDDYGRLHQSKVLYSTDFASRFHWRPLYYLESGRDLANEPAYVGSMQVALARLGYYCGPINGVFSDELSFAIAQMQKSYSMRVTGTITLPVRRALHLP